MSYFIATSSNSNQLAIFPHACAIFIDKMDVSLISKDSASVTVCGQKYAITWRLHTAKIVCDHYFLVKDIKIQSKMLPPVTQFFVV